MSRYDEGEQMDMQDALRREAHSDRMVRSAYIRQRTEQQRLHLEDLLAYLEADLELNGETLELLLQRRRETGMSQDQIERIDSLKVTNQLQETLKEECCSICLE